MRGCEYGGLASRKEGCEKKSDQGKRTKTRTDHFLFFFLPQIFFSTWRIIRGHWDKPRWAAVKAAYQRMYGKSMASRVKGETTGDLEVSSLLFPLSSPILFGRECSTESLSSSSPTLQNILVAVIG